MDKTTQPNSISSIRTLAKDMAFKSSLKSSSTPLPASNLKSTPNNPAPNFVDDRGKQLYQAPKKVKAPLPLPPVRNASVGEKATEQTLKPISGPKKSGEPTIVVDNEEAATSMIIRDTKHNRFHLLPAVISSLKFWLTEVKEKYFTKKVAKYTVPDATLRKGVIQKATSKTGKVATFDNISLQERVRDRQNRAIPKNPVTTWTANTEPGFLLLESPEPEEKVSNVQVVPRKSFRTTPPTPKPVSLLPVTQSPIQKPPVAVEAPPVVPVAPVASVASVIPVITPSKPPVVVVEAPPFVPVVTPAIKVETAPVPVTNTPPPPSEEVIESVTYISEPKQKVTRVRLNSAPKVTLLKPTNFKERLFILNTNLISMTIAGVALVLVLVSAFGYFSYQANFETIVLTTIPSHPTILNAPLQTLYLTEQDRDTLFAQIIDSQKQSAFPTLQLALATTPNGDTLLSPSAILASLKTSVGTVFSKSITALYFGNFNQGTPFIVLKITDPTTARGGMLAWEESLHKDLLPMLLAFNPNSGNILTDSKFKDITLNQVDVRSLVNADGQEVLIYGLTAQNIIVITTNQMSLSELFKLIK